ncbi:DNA-processing protein DprA [Tengunoibacter tsumagoiensis]|uniref:DNA processing protein DprA n=1 Tax=Tengunoibacter tsumagoiensis TaxID=2014871 RepID=A0A401ZWV6_9CHLR|nr:DNA-processing protein DprA [Tengunoibacter tsumagoiensis]GCE11355.1 DNA processing protein DprA [Tengunoibacter tsumagoiensis]
MGKRQQKMVVYDAAAHYYPSQTLSLEQLAHWIAFSRVLGIGSVRFKRLLDYFADDAQLAWRADSKTLAQIEGLDQKTIDSFLQQRTKINPEQELERLTARCIQILTWKDDAYPPLLKKMENPPPILYLCGNLTDDDRRYSIAVVGTRKMSAYGRQVTQEMCQGLVKSHVTVVSGLALGVDTVAHTTALSEGGRTLAVLACGLDTIYPQENYHLARRIVESGQGALITTFPLGVKPDGKNFPARNHIISGLSLGVLVTEAPLKSGAIITANLALSQGREVYAIPHQIHAASGSGTNHLLQNGAHLVTQIDDVLGNLNLYMLPQQSEMQALIPENDAERILLNLLARESFHIDDLIRESQLEPQVVSATLTIMELKGMVRMVGTMQYASG